jgi:hypothetical protein
LFKNQKNYPHARWKYAEPVEREAIILHEFSTGIEKSLRKSRKTQK